MMSDNRKIGTGLLALGGIFIFFGVLFFFESGLLAMGKSGETQAVVSTRINMAQQLPPRYASPRVAILL